jgi:hypothetical protein
MSSLRPQDRKSLCRFAFADGRQSRTPRPPAISTIAPTTPAKIPRLATPINSPAMRNHHPLTYLESTLTEIPTSVDSKALARNLSPLDATLTKN